MPNFLVELGLSFGVLIATQRALRMYKLTGKGYTFLSLTIAVIVFAYLPFMCNDGGYPTTFNDEKVGDQVSSINRWYLGLIFLFFFGLYLIIN